CDLFCDVPVTGADVLVSGDAQANDVDFGPRGAHDVVQPLAEQGPGPVQPRGVDHHQLAVRTVHDAPDGVARGLRAARRDGDLVAHHRVGQRRLAGIRPPHEADEAGPERLCAGSVGVGHPTSLPSRFTTRLCTGVQFFLYVST